MVPESKLKGVNKAAVKKLKLNAFLKTVLLKDRQTCTFRKISCKNHKLSTNFNVKQALFGYDDKVFIQKCGVHTLKFGESKMIECECAFTRSNNHKK